MKAFFIACAIAILAIVPIPALQAMLATTASTLFESTPFILAAVLLAAIAPRSGARLAPLLGCGCSGLGALSIPVAAATTLTFGPLIAAARWIAAFAVSRMLAKRYHSHHDYTAGGELHALLPFAIAAGTLLSILRPATLGIHPVWAALGAAVVAAVASPCGFGAIALAAALHRVTPAATVAVLCIAGICDTRSLTANRRTRMGHDAFAYFLAAAACALVASHHGNALLNPRFTLPLYCSAGFLFWLAWKHRHAASPAVRCAPALMLAAAILSVPPPIYFATQTTLSDAFAGEPIAFRGVLARDGARWSLVRYEVTCCRADAQPVAVLLSRPPREREGQWITARGHLLSSAHGLSLDIASYETTAAPADPFLYR